MLRTYKIAYYLFLLTIFTFVISSLMPGKAHAIVSVCSSESPSGLFCEKFYNSVNPGSTDPVLQRDVSSINYNWGNGSPDPLVNVDNFSGTWKGKFNFDAAKYQFTTTSDDGVRLYIDGVIAIDKWMDQSTKSYVYQKTMTAGEHEIELHFYEKKGYSSVRLNWFKPSALNCPSDAPDGVFCAKYYNNENITGDFIESNTVPEVNFDWVFGAPVTSVNNDYFSIIYEGKFNFAKAGVYKFTTSVDDGVRLYIDDVLVIDKWIAQPVTSYQASKYLNEGTHKVKMAFYEANGVAVSRLSWSLEKEGCNATDYPLNSFCARYYKPISGIDTMSIDSTTVPQINYNFGTSSPSSLVPNDNFSATYRGMFEILSAGTYMFTTNSDDGVRLKVDGATIIDKWVNQPATSHYALKHLESGTYPIELKYFENGGNANVKLSWMKIDQNLTCSSDNPTNKFCAKFYNGTNFDVGPLLSYDVANINKNWGGNSPSAPINNDFFSANYNGTFNFAVPGVYRFTTSTDDGTRLRVDGTTVIDKWIAQPYTSYIADVAITSGTHNISMDYLERTGAAIVKLTWVKIAELPEPPMALESSTTEPASGTTEPVPGTTQPVEGTSEPVLPTTEPNIGSTEPMGAATEPGGSTTVPEI